MKLVLRFLYSLLKQLVSCHWFLAYCEIQVRRLEEVHIEISGQETSTEHKVLVLYFVCDFFNFPSVFLNESVFLSLCACEFYFFKARD